MSFASKLQEIRQKNGVSQEQLAELLNVSRQSVSKWERGKGYPEIDKIIFISEHFGVTIDELLKESITDAPFQRRPISLEKDTSRTVREIYPGEQQQSFPAQEVQQPVNLVPYGNYQFAQNQSVQGSGNKRSFSGRKKSRKPLTRRQIAFRIALVLVCSFVGFWAGIGIDRLTNEDSGYSSTYIYSDYAPRYSDINYNVRWYMNYESGDYYLFDADTEYGIASQIWNEDMDTYMTLNNPETDERIFSYNWYYDECFKIEIDGDIFVMPEYFTDTVIESSEYDDYCIGEDQNGVKRFVPKYILPSYWLNSDFLKGSEEINDADLINKDTAEDPEE